MMQVRTTDVTGAEDPTPAVVTWRVDLTPPELFIVHKPLDITTSREALFALNASESFRARYRLDGGDWSAVNELDKLVAGTLKFRISDLLEGKHLLEVEPSDEAGNVGQMLKVAWIIDAGGPRAKLVMGPEKHSHVHHSAFHLQTGEGDCVYEYRLDRGKWRSAMKGPDAKWEPIAAERWLSGGWMTMRVQAGFHTIEIRAIDAAGNKDQGEVAYEWVVY